MTTPSDLPAAASGGSDVRDKEITALMQVLAEMRRTGSSELNHWADRIQDAVEEAGED